MSVRVGVLGVSHVHAPSYVACLKAADAELVGHWDEDATLSADFAERHCSEQWGDMAALLDACDAVVIAGKNVEHANLITESAKAGKSILCEKPLAAFPGDAKKISDAVNSSGVMLMTAFPCPFSPAFESAMAKAKSGEIGRVLAVNATNHGRCPGGWFTEKDKSGGGAMIDHTVHVADLLRRLYGEDASSVYAVTGNNVYGKDWDDSAVLTVNFPSGVFATIDASWSRPASYRVWGDVTLKIVGEKGLIELDLFALGAERYREGHSTIGYGTGLDRLMVDEFLAAHNEGRPPKVTMYDGLQASAVALAGYESAKSGQPVNVA